MGGLPCWKGIIDQRNALVQVMDCMAESIRIAGATGEQLPDYDDLDNFVKAANSLATISQGIQKKVGKAAE